ncbi:MAG TPA: acetyl-CoA hydrolase/transferase C-terminal domain-containing protein [Acidimicrobiales bacterium]|nr:acetyl-CoA hydrolase/transferase C-terminal domain-containing protein [Acidimicrobiales bacterium]
MQLVTTEQLAARLSALASEEPRVVVSGNFATPWTLLGLVDQALERYRAFVLNPQPGWPCRRGVIVETPFVGPGVRDDEHLDYVPMRLSLVPRLFDSLRPPDVALVHTSTPRGGRVSLGIEVNILPAAVERVRARGGLVVAQLNPAMPYTRGDAELDVDLFDLGVEVEAALPSPVLRAVDDDTAAIGERIARFAADGGTLQLGIGQVPDAATLHLRGRRRLGIWSEMVSDGVLALEQAGALDPARPLAASFLFGSPELYDWAGDNDRLTMTRTETINDPGRIAEHPGMLSINTALQIDLFAQANASYLGHRVYSGFGGQPDFVVGALHSPGGHAVIGLRSWHDKSDTSTVVPVLASPVSSLQHSAVVTEQGTAEIFGRSQPAQARLLIEQCAHPRARDELWRAARRLGLVRRSVEGALAEGPADH